MMNVNQNGIDLTAVPTPESIEAAVKAMKDESFFADSTDEKIKKNESDKESPGSEKTNP